MGRFLLFLFLVVAVPLGVYWAGNDGRLGGLPGEIRALRGTRPTEPTSPEPEQEPDEEEKEKEQERKEPDEEKEPDGQKKPETKQPRPEKPYDKANRLFREGRFAEASLYYTGIDPKQRALSQLGAAFVQAFPTDLPDARYEIVKTRSGDTFEGFVDESDGRLKLTAASGKSYSFPTATIASRNPLTVEDAQTRIARQTVQEGLAPKTSGNRLFALIQGACAAGRPDAIGPLLQRSLELDEQRPYFLSAVRNRVRTEYQKDLYLAFATCQSPLVMGGGEPVVKVPTQLDGNRDGKPYRDPYAPKVKSAKAKKLMAEATPHRKKGEELYRKIVLAGVDKAKLADVEKAIAELEKALELYEKAAVAEDNDAIFALLRKCSKLNFNLRFWKQQIDNR